MCSPRRQTGLPSRAPITVALRAALELAIGLCARFATSANASPKVPAGWVRVRGIESFVVATSVWRSRDSPTGRAGADCFSVSKRRDDTGEPKGCAGTGWMNLLAICDDQQTSLRHTSSAPALIAIGERSAGTARDRSQAISRAWQRRNLRRQSSRTGHSCLCARSGFRPSRFGRLGSALCRRIRTKEAVHPPAAACRRARASVSPISGSSSAILGPWSMPVRA